MKVHAIIDAGDGTKAVSISEPLCDLPDFHMVQHACRMVLMVELSAAQGVRAELERMQAVMPMRDPTWYMKHADNLMAHTRMVEAFLTFRRELQRLVEGGR